MTEQKDGLSTLRHEATCLDYRWVTVSRPQTPRPRNRFLEPADRLARNARQETERAVIYTGKKQRLQLRMQGQIRQESQ